MDLFSGQVSRHLADGALFPHLEVLELSNCVVDWTDAYQLLTMRGNKAGNGVKNTIKRLRLNKCNTTSSVWALAETKKLVEEFEWLP